MKITDLARAVAPNSKVKIVGIRPGEKIHECLIIDNESRRALEFKGFFIIQPDHPWWTRGSHAGGRKINEDYNYSSDNNDKWLTVKDLQRMIG
jgi:UDP-N-acetylglucosamine 4,6-dehydratase